MPGMPEPSGGAANAAVPAVPDADALDLPPGGDDNCPASGETFKKHLRTLSQQHGDVSYAPSLC